MVSTEAKLQRPGRVKGRVPDAEPCWKTRAGVQVHILFQNMESCGSQG